MLEELGNFMRGKGKPKADDLPKDRESTSERMLIASYDYMKNLQKTKDSIREGDMVSFIRDNRKFVGRVVKQENNPRMGQVRSVGKSEYTVLVDVVANVHTGATYRCSVKYSEVTRL